MKCFRFDTQANTDFRLVSGTTIPLFWFGLGPQRGIFRQLLFVFETRDCLLVIAKQPVNVAQLAISDCFGSITAFKGESVEQLEVKVHLPSSWARTRRFS